MNVGAVMSPIVSTLQKKSQSLRQYPNFEGKLLYNLFQPFKRKASRYAFGRLWRRWRRGFGFNPSKEKPVVTPSSLVEPGSGVHIVSTLQKKSQSLRLSKVRLSETLSLFQPFKRKASRYALGLAWFPGGQ